jgi:hypothetical protein
MREDPHALADMEESPWAPSSALQRKLGHAIWATLGVGILLVAQSALTLLQDNPIVPAINHGLGWLALVPGFWIVAAYAGLGVETEYRSLVKSCVCLFGALILLQLLDLIGLDALPWFGTAALWVVLAVGLIILAILPFTLGEAAFGETEAMRRLRAGDVAACRAASTALRPGDRVLANWGKAGTWYAGSLKAVEAGEFQVTYDDGDTETLPGECVLLEQLTPANTLAIGDRVLARWWGGSVFYSGAVTELRPGEAHVRYDDGDTEWQKADVVRIPRPADFALSATPEDAMASDAPASRSMAGKIGATLGTGGVLAIFCVIKAVGKGVARFMRHRGAGDVDWFEVAGIVLAALAVLLGAIYYIWFAGAKIAARSRLGAIAVLLGLAELLGLVGIGGMLIWGVIQVYLAANQPGLTDEQIEAEIEKLGTQLNAGLVPYELLFTLVWAALTMWLFASLRSRHDPAADLRAADELRA